MPRIATQTDDSLVVVRLGAWAELSSNGAGQAECQAIEYAVLSDGQEVTLTNDRGWGSSGQLEKVSVENALRSTLTCLLPDDAEESGQQHEWDKFLLALAEFGVRATVADLRELPFTVSISAAITLPRDYAI